MNSNKRCMPTAAAQISAADLLQQHTHLAEPSRSSTEVSAAASGAIAHLQHSRSHESGKKGNELMPE